MTRHTTTFTKASAFGLITAFSAYAGAEEAGTNVPTAAPRQTPVALSGPGAPVEPAAAPARMTSDEPVIDASTTRTTFPNRPLLITGAIVLGGSYGASVIVGALSDREADKKLYYPVVGPWMDLTERDCDVNECNNKTLNQALLIGDGVLQGLGALSMLLSVVVPEKTTRSWYLIGNEDVVVIPRVGGLAAIGRF